jgi:5-methylthioadenosine/S-adenosylhomocysteine deaminase
VKNDHSPAMYPILHPYGHLVFQAGKGDVHTVLVDGRVVKRDGRLADVGLGRARSEVAATLDHLQTTMGDEEWAAGMTPELPEQELFDNPYQYTSWDAGRGARKVHEDRA